MTPFPQGLAHRLRQRAPRYRRRARTITEYSRTLLLFAAMRVIAPLARRLPRYREVWLVSERGVDARDNGLHIFRYLRRTHPQINAVYVIDPSCPDYDRIAGLGRTVARGTWRHHLYFVVSTAKISTHVMGYSPHAYLWLKLDGRFGLVPGVKVFLRHGIGKDDMPGLHHPPTNVDLFVTSVAREAAFVKERFGHPEGVVQQIGLARFDALTPLPSRRQILLMPTWRMGMLKCDTEEQFRQTRFFREYDGLLRDPRLLALLEEHDYRLVLYPHHEMKRFAHLFTLPSDRVTMLMDADCDLQHLLRESDALLTDYSSVFFDMAYQRKPVLYFQFDEAEYRRTQYQEGYFEYRRDGFGPVVVSRDDLIEELQALVAGGAVLSPEYAARVEDFFPPQTGDNCQRTVEAILELVGRRTADR